MFRKKCTHVTGQLEIGLNHLILNRKWINCKICFVFLGVGIKAEIRLTKLTNQNNKL